MTARTVTASDRFSTWPGRPGEFHPEPPTDPDVNLSIHPARATPRKPTGFRQDSEFLRLLVDSILTWMTRPLRSSPITSLLRSYESVRPSAPHRYPRLAVFAAWASPFASERLVPAVPRDSLHPLHAPSTPVAVRSVIRHPADLSQVNHTTLVSTTLEFLTTRLRRVHFRSSLGRSPARVCSRAFPPTLTTTALYRSSLEAV
jgi:hypothetical protein